METTSVFHVMIFQSTLPYGSDCISICSAAMQQISIHAPLRERPKQRCKFALDQLISIHAPLRERLTSSMLIIRKKHFNPRSLTGATSPDARCRSYRSDFNPRSLTGATFYWPQRFRQRWEISIHAPLRERRDCSKNCLLPRRFQSTLPYGSDLIEIAPAGGVERFQSTLPYGSDRKFVDFVQNDY